jgi:Rps23 Pro-64 3,4-dihydroxylase Tpa1-like proline 4-hydroxylase
LCLKKELQKNIIEYIKRLNNKINHPVIYDQHLETFSMQMQKYNKNEGKYTYHNDARIEKERTRVITFIWYLNDVTDGGETEIWKYLKIKPTTGKLLLFPSCWTFPHRGNMPISSDKYIITGWLWSNIK